MAKQKASDFIVQVRVKDVVTQFDTAATTARFFTCVTASCLSFLYTMRHERFQGTLVIYPP